MVGKDCKGCAQRFVGCHSVCEKYLKAKEEYNEKRAGEIKRKIGFSDYYSFKTDAIIKGKKRRGQK